MDTLKTCADCGISKSLSEYQGSGVRRRDGSMILRSRCTPCQREYLRRWRAGVSKERRRDKHLRDNYGITLAQYEGMAEAQYGMCPACFSNGPLVVDHDHATGEVRGLLCSDCNKALGCAKDNLHVLRSLAAYIQQYQRQEA